jgi:hypothetical protein
MRRFLSGSSSSPTAFLTKDRRTETMMAASRVSAQRHQHAVLGSGLDIPLKMMKKMGTEKTSTVIVHERRLARMGGGKRAEDETSE